MQHSFKNIRIPLSLTSFKNIRIPFSSTSLFLIKLTRGRGLQSMSLDVNETVGVKAIMPK